MKKFPLRIAHRGDSGNTIENTIQSFQSALDKGVDGIELDVQWVHGELVVFHDPSLHRVAKIAKNLDEVPLHELLSLDLGNGCTIPTLSQAADAIRGRASLNIELKGFIPPEAIKLALENLRAQGWENTQLLVSSFNHRLLNDLRKILPQVNLAPIYYGYSLNETTTAHTLGSSTVVLHHQLLSAERLAEFHQHKIAVFVYVVNERPDIARMCALGVDGIISNFPERMDWT